MNTRFEIVPLITACGVPLRYIGSSRDDASRRLTRTMLPRPETWSLRVASTSLHRQIARQVARTMLLQLPVSVAAHLASPRTAGARIAAHPEGGEASEYE